MPIGFGKPRTVIPPPNQGAESLVQRRVEEAASRAAVRTRTAVIPDSSQCRVWVRNPRSTIPCPCSVRDPHSPSANPVGSNVRVVIHPDEGDMIGGPDAGYPLAHMEPDSGEMQPSPSIEDPTPNPSWLEDVTRILLGNGRRCGLCWGTGWINGHRLWGGSRLLFCVADDDYVTLLDEDGPMVDVDSPTPTFVGPGSVTWSVDVPQYYRTIDALRVRNGLAPAEGDYVLEARTPADNGVWRDAAEVVGAEDGVPATLADACLEGLEFRLTLADDVRVSHVEMVLRGEDLVHVQLPQRQQVASQELIAPFYTEEFELDPVVGAIERGTLLEVPGLGGRPGMVWIVTDVMVKQTQRGSVFGVVGNIRNAQPTDVVIAALMDDSAIGIQDPGNSTRGLEPSIGGEPTGVDGESDESEAAIHRGVQPRAGGGTSDQKPVSIVLSSGRAK